MANPVAKKAGLAALETAMHAIMPQLQETLTQIRGDIWELAGKISHLEQKTDARLSELDQRFDAKLTQLEQRLDIKLTHLEGTMNARFDQTRDVINELGLRITRVEGKVEAYTEMVHHHTTDVGTLIERVVRVEMQQTQRKRRAS